MHRVCIVNLEIREIHIKVIPTINDRCWIAGSVADQNSLGLETFSAQSIRNDSVVVHRNVASRRDWNNVDLTDFCERRAREERGEVRVLRPRLGFGGFSWNAESAGVDSMFAFFWFLNREAMEQADWAVIYMLTAPYCRKQVTVKDGQRRPPH